MAVYIVRRCKRCGEAVYRFKKGEEMSDLVKGCNIAIHMLVCDREAFDEHLKRHF